MSTNSTTGKTPPKWFEGTYKDYVAYMRKLAAKPHRRNFDSTPEGRKRAAKAGKLGAARIHGQ